MGFHLKRFVFWTCIVLSPLAFAEVDCRLLRLETTPEDFSPTWVVNSGNPEKMRQFKVLLQDFPVQFEYQDIPEPLATPLEVIIYKASRFRVPGKVYIVEDTALEVEGADIGVNIRWLINDLRKYEGRHAQWLVHLAYRFENQVYVYRGEVKGRIGPKLNNENSFGDCFIPEGSKEPLNKLEIHPQYNARAQAVHSLLSHKVSGIYPASDTWTGPWQPDH